ncbi:MAG: hypothetical protein E7197_04945 [Anaerovibrio sp.]|uniref:polysialyltransferase family glycosyltransferase n=1 Tax=Anaerovibrio sp. TaxID=1872532 RepID=UPI0025BC8EE9|nr:polysialyltransferase family glycosyltransferase [Anaerovibrio sp.]MBE6099383.1 hypothetical protein [Anaerovibrio sp.]
MRILFVCSTEFQILNALNIKVHLFPDSQADIVLQRAEYSGIAARLRPLGIFDNICCARPYLMDLHEYKLALRDTGHCDTSFGGAILNSLVNMWRKMAGGILGPKYHLNNLLDDYKAIRDNHYDKVFMQSGNAIVRNFYADMHGKTEMAILDEGIGSYCDNTICHKDTKADAVYLYDPDVAIYASDKDIKFVKIPKLSPDDTKFVNIANKVFDYIPSGENINGKLIFFDQGGELMPSYLRNPNWLIKFLLANSIKKHKETYDSYKKQIEAYYDIAAGRTVYIKYHPRTPEEVINEYDKNVFKAIEPRKLPWELYAINNRINKCTIVTITSSAVCLFPMTIGGDNKCVLLYECVGYDLPQKYRDFFARLASKYKDNISVINDLDVLKNN